MSLPVLPAQVNPDNAEFFSGLEQGRLLLAICDRCQVTIWYPRHHCPVCGGGSVTWTEATGRAHIYSFTIVRRGLGEWADCAPYVVAYVELEEGPRVITNVLCDDVAVVRIGAAVTPAIEFDGRNPPVLRFRLA